MTAVIAKQDLLDFATQTFEAAAVAPTLASHWADILVWANLRGTDSHGVMRIPRYLSLIETGEINPAPDMRIDRDAGAIAVIEADRAPGGPAMLCAVETAITRAQKFSIGWCAARNLSHAGAIGYFASAVAEAGLAGIVMTASGKPLMAYHGSRISGVSTNPLAIAVPAKHRPPILLDMSTSNIAFGKLLNAREQGRDIPIGWGLDDRGKDTTDPQAVQALTPLGGPKGSGLSLMIECLASLAVGNPLLSRWLSKIGEDGTPAFNGIVIAVDLSALGDPDQFDEDLETLSTLISELPEAEGIERIYLPGERGNAEKANRERNGIPIPEETWTRLKTSAARLGVPIPSQTKRR